ncbi:type II toxin-antitoxin system HicB family antitoxin [Bosea sp. TWI1241]|uniref:type II toxin-antitoxin system HicB family antitoxin n=1 Tax=Bosea sp. TWI1241 TaxID=3148904 RepID=UPI003209BDBB
MTLTFGVAVTREADDWVVSVRDLPEVVTSGASLEEALALATDAIEVVVAGRMDDDEPLPDPTAVLPGEHAVPLPAGLAAKAAVYVAWKASGLRKTELAQRLARDESVVRRILDPRHGTKLEHLDEAARALGGRLVVSFEPAA